MEKSEILSLLKNALGEPMASPSREMFLSHKLDTAIERLKDNGIVFNDPYTIADAGLIVDFAEFLTSDRATQNGYPRYLEFAIHNRLIQQRTKENVR